MKKVIFLMIDSLMPEVLEDGIDRGMLPALAFFKEKGMYWNNCTSVFPTMTASVDCSLVTGEYPDKHKIPALVWYDPDKRKLVNYTNGSLPVLKLGLGQCIDDALCQMNDRHLSRNVSTLYEELALKGKTTGSINLIAHRSLKKYKVNLPFLVKLVTGFRSYDDVSGPDLFTLGSLVRSNIQPKLPWGFDETVFKHYGINDDFAIRLLNHLITHDTTPDFTMVYLPDNDHQVHIHPRKAMAILQKVDKRLQSVLNQFSSWEHALEKYVFIITGDHGQTLIGKSEEQHNIKLEDLLLGMRITPYGGTPAPEDDLLIANNERMTYLYPFKHGVEAEIIHRLKQDIRIDIIAYRDGEWISVCSGEKEGRLRFRRKGKLKDVYGAGWTIEGNPGILDLQISGNDDALSYGDFPDVLARLNGALYSQDIPMIAITAKPGYEFKSAFAPTHLNGGSHGSLHRKDSTIPLIIAGSEDQTRPFEHPRLIDLKPYILQLLN
ncbi:alkaline phosphatase family protein [Ammoniphilus sp. CFH 90114]|uniref:alkaline phosphatase family protein n=1 Tax=Ammoniphilus sp. CFH 90114 TaxID=2493665 RepID=UPI00100FB71E|nr:alkaline phosphatase family protein [Ammoniphilus sp. CFH 90114]RXT05857.1 alkaline phosphatase family protein [Ammoniphilus sp. CFH 90114]